MLETVSLSLYLANEAYILVSSKWCCQYMTVCVCACACACVCEEDNESCN